MRAVLSSVWTWLRAVSGDSAYETYLGRQRALGRAPLSRKAFYLETLDRRYATISRCC
jgi:uncharacterized short protein YbdD (DUF466 family)